MKQIKKETYYTIILHNNAKDWAFVNLRYEDYEINRETRLINILSYKISSQLPFTFFVQDKRLSQPEAISLHIDCKMFLSEGNDGELLQEINKVKLDINESFKDLYTYLQPKGNKREQHIKKTATELNNNIKKAYAFLDALI